MVKAEYWYGFCEGCLTVNLIILFCYAGEVFPFEIALAGEDG